MSDGNAGMAPPGADGLSDEARLAVALALAGQAYRDGHVRVASADPGGRGTLVASRQGVFAVSHHDHVRLVHGLFFGAAIRDDDIYLFESCDAPAMRSFRGRIVRLRRRGGAIAEAEVLATGLDNGCHQIDFVDDRLCVVDTYNQRILRFSADFRTHEELFPLPRVARHRDWAAGYAHCNSLLQVGDRILLLLHNGGLDRASEVAVLTRDWQLLALHPMPGRACHNLAVLEDGTVLGCGSMAGELIDAQGTVAHVSSLMTRGLCVGADEIAVGASVFSMRRKRNAVPGTVTFLDRRYRQRAVIDLPAAPTDIRRLDGADRGQSRCLRDFDAARLVLPAA